MPSTRPEGQTVPTLPEHGHATLSLTALSGYRSPLVPRLAPAKSTPGHHQCPSLQSSPARRPPAPAAAPARPARPCSARRRVRRRPCAAPAIGSAPTYDSKREECGWARRFWPRGQACQRHPSGASCRALQLNRLPLDCPLARRPLAMSQGVALTAYQNTHLDPLQRRNHGFGDGAGPARADKLNAKEAQLVAQGSGPVLLDHQWLSRRPPAR